MNILLFEKNLCVGTDTLWEKDQLTLWNKAFLVKLHNWDKLTVQISVALHHGLQITSMSFTAPDSRNIDFIVFLQEGVKIGREGRFEPVATETLFDFFVQRHQTI